MSKKEIILIIILFCISLVRFLFFLPEKPAYDKFVGESVSLEGIVIDTPDIRAYNQRILLKIENQESNV